MIRAKVVKAALLFIAATAAGDPLGNHTFFFTITHDSAPSTSVKEKGLGTGGYMIYSEGSMMNSFLHVGYLQN